MSDDKVRIEVNGEVAAVEFVNGFAHVLCQCGWSLWAAGSAGIMAWHAATLKAHRCRFKKEPS